MPNNNIISNTLDIKYKNITFGFNDEVLTKETIDEERCFVYHGTLSYTPIVCEYCGHRNENKIINYGFTTTRALVNRVSNYQTYLELKRQRFLCKHGESTFVVQTNLSEVFMK